MAGSLAYKVKPFQEASYPVSGEGSTRGLIVEGDGDDEKHLHLEH